MGQYYFTVSSLPWLDFESEPPVSMDTFNDVCESTLREEDYSLVKKASLDDFDFETANPVLKRWTVFEQSLRNELAKLRGANLGIDAQKYVKQFIDNTTTPAIAAGAFKQETPLKTELYLQKERWTFLDELEAGHFFDVENLIVYSLRLQILERKVQFKKDAGNENFTEIYEQIKTSIREI